MSSSVTSRWVTARKRPGTTELMRRFRAWVASWKASLPSTWKNGSVTGLRARGGFEVDLRWKGGKLLDAVVRSEKGGACTVRFGAKTQEITVAPGGETRVGRAM